MLTVKAINEDGYEDVFCCHVVRARPALLLLETHGVQEQTLWFDRPHGYEDAVYYTVYVSCEGQTIGKYKRDVKPPLGIAKAA